MSDKHEDNKPFKDKDTGIEVPAISPIAILHPADGKVYCFFSTENGNIQCIQLTIGDTPDSKGNPTIKENLYFLQYPYGDEEAGNYARCRNKGYFGVCAVDYGFVVVHRRNGEDNQDDTQYPQCLSYFPVASLPQESNQTWKAHKSFRIPFTDNGGPEDLKNGNIPYLSNIAATVTLAPNTKSKLNLMLAVRSSSTSITFLQTPLDTNNNYAPLPDQKDWLKKVCDAKGDKDGKGMTSTYVSLHTNKRENAVAAYNTDTTYYTIECSDDEPWVQHKMSGSDSLSSNGIWKSTAPTFAYKVFPPEEHKDETFDMRVERWTFSVDDDQEFASTYKHIGYYRGVALAPFETSNKDSKVKWPIIGIVEGAPPVPDVNIEIETPTPNNQSTSVSIIETTSNYRSVVGVTKMGSYIKGEAEFGVINKFAVEFAFRQGIETQTEKLSGRSFTQEIVQESEPEYFGEAGPNGQRPTRIKRTGSVFYLKSTVYGYNTYFIDKDKNRVVDAPEFLFVVSAGVSVASTPYFISSKDVIPGDLESYANPDRAIEIQNSYLASLLLDGDNEDGDDSGYVSFSWSSGGGSVRQCVLQFSEENSSTEFYMDVSAGAGQAWEIEGLTKGKILVGVEYSYASSVSNSKKTASSLCTSIDINSQDGLKGTYKSYIANTYFLASEKDNNKTFKDSLGYTNGLTEDQQETNSSLLKKLDFKNSTPWMIKHVVSDAEKW